MVDKSERTVRIPGNSAPTDFELQLKESNISLLQSEKYLLQQERDTLKLQLDKYKMLCSSGDASDELYLSTSSRMDRQSFSDYDHLKGLCERAMSELTALKTRQGKTIQDSETYRKDAEYYRSKYKTAREENQQFQGNLAELHNHLNGVKTEKQQLELELNNSQRSRDAERREISELRQLYYENKMHDPDGRIDTLTVSEQENWRNQYDSLVEQFSQHLKSEHSNALKKCEIYEKENIRLKRAAEDAIGEKNLMMQERSGLKQQVSQINKQWEVALREKNEANENYHKAQQQLDQTAMELNRVMSARWATHKDVARLQEERNLAVDEHRMVMSERAEVIKEIEKLQDEREIASQQIDEIEKEKKTALSELETLRREISSALDDRDKAIKECYDLREKIDILQKDTQRSAESEKAVAEIEAANRQVEKCKEEMLEAQREAEISRNRRDWAFKERDKVVFERESIKSLCDSLRNERDKAVSEISDAVRHGDDAKRQRNDLLRECQELRELLEQRSLHGKPRFPLLRRGQTTDSRDSAIDTEFLSNVFSETFEVDLNLNPDEPCFDLSVGSPDSTYSSPISVSHVARGSPAEGKLQVSDIVLRMNNVDLTSHDRKKALQLLQTSRGSVHLVIRRRKTSRVTPKSVPCHVRVTSAFDLLQNLAKGLFVAQLTSSLKDSGLCVGDRITHLDGESVDEKSLEESLGSLANYDNHPVHVKVLRALCGSPTLGGVFGSDLSEADRIYSPTGGSGVRSPNVQRPLADMSVQTDLSELSRNNSTVRRKRSSDAKDKTAWKSLFETKERVRPRLDSVFPGIDVTSRTTVKTTRLPTSARETKSSLLDRAYDKIFRRGEHKRGRPTIQLLQPEERTVIAELESVVQHYESSNGTYFSTKQKVPKMPEKLPSGTWPKYKGSPLDSIENILEVNDKRSPKVVNRKSVQSLSGVRTAPWTYTDIPIDDMDASVTPSSGTLKSPKNPTYRQSFQPEMYQGGGGFTPRTPPEKRHRLSIYPESVDLDSSSMSSSMDFQMDGARSRTKDFYSPLTRPMTGPALQISSPLLPGATARPFSPGTSSLYGTVQSQASRLSHANAGRSPMTLQPSPFEERRPFLYGGTHQHHHHYQPPGLPMDNVRRPISLGVASRSMWNESDYSHPRMVDNQRIYHPPGGLSSAKSSLSRMSTTSGSIDRSSPVPVDRSAGPPLYDVVRKRPQLGQVRTVVLQCYNDQPGFKIKSHNGGIYVSMVKEVSLAAKSGMVVGDQLLEVGPINLRSASYDEAKKVLLSAGHTLDMRLQYRGPFPSTSDSSDLVDGSLPSSVATSSDSLRGPTGTLKGSQRRSVDTVTSEAGIKPRLGVQEARSVRFTKGLTEPLGVNLIGGNVYGIFVHSVTPGSVATGPKGLCCGEQILEYNGVNMRTLVLEKAMYELCKPVQNVSIVAQYCPEVYELACSTSGDSIFVKALWDRDKSQLQDEDLVFRRGDILFVDNTLYNGEMGLWRAWLLDQQTDKVECGIIPNRYRAEEEVLALQQSNGDLMDSLDPHRRSSRRSIFKRKKQHSSSSASSSHNRELASFSSASLGCDTFSVAPEEPLIPTYQRVTKLIYQEMRPVLILGPLSEVIVERLLLNHPQKYARCPPQTHTIDSATSDDTDVIESRHFSGLWEQVTVKSIKEVAQKNMHCVVDVSVSSVERMLGLNIHPIVLVVKFRTPSVIREVRDGSFSSSKISHKAAKELFELAGRMEMEHGKVITAIIPGGTSLSYMASLANNAIDAAQTKPEWIVEGLVI